MCTGGFIGMSSKEDDEDNVGDCQVLREWTEMCVVSCHAVDLPVSCLMGCVSMYTQDSSLKVQLISVDYVIWTQRSRVRGKMWVYISIRIL